MTYFMVHSLRLAWMECKRKCRKMNASKADREVVTKLYYS